MAKEIITDIGLVFHFVFGVAKNCIDKRLVPIRKRPNGDFPKMHRHNPTFLSISHATSESEHHVFRRKPRRKFLRFHIVSNKDDILCLVFL